MPDPTREELIDSANTMRESFDFSAQQLTCSALQRLEYQSASRVLGNLIARLRADGEIIDKLPKTADGVSVYIGDTVWIWEIYGYEDRDLSHARSVTVGVDENEPPSLCGYTPGGEGPGGTLAGPYIQEPEFIPLDQCYSTRAAAEAAREAKGVGDG